MGKSLKTATVPVDSACVGDRWLVTDIEELGKRVALIAMGQATYAAEIIEALSPATPALSHEALFAAAREQLAITGSTEDERDASRWRRDGFIFECISWMVAREAGGKRCFLKDPHLKSTTQGIDGLMVQLHDKAIEVQHATIFEDKCSSNPRQVFWNQVMKSFRDHHANKRAPELVAAGAALIEKSGANAKQAVSAAERILNLSYRKYRAALTIEAKDDTAKRRSAIFKGYDDLSKVAPNQRIAATLVVDGDLRAFFETLASAATSALDEWEDN
jgi:hypothetical protein